MESESLCGLGNVYHQMGEFSSALKFHQNDLEIAEQLDMPSLQSRACGNIGKFFQVSLVCAVPIFFSLSCFQGILFNFQATFTRPWAIWIRRFAFRSSISP